MSYLKQLINCKVMSTIKQEDDENEWLKVRSRGIGGSDIGTICGVNRYSSPRMIYLKKTGQFDEGVEEFSDAAKERMRFGHLLEPIVANEFSTRTGLKVVESPATLVHKDYPWALANVDRLIINNEGIVEGILECKTAGEFMDDEWAEGEVPISYLYQLNWYLWVTGLSKGAIACLVGGNKFYYYEVYRNDEIIEEIMLPKAKHFWEENVIKLVVPDITGSDADTEYLADINKDVVKGSELVIEDDTINELAAVVKECKAKIKELEKIETEAANRIKDVLKDNETGYTLDYVVKWPERVQNRVDNEKLKIMYPEVYKDCLKTIRFRAFSVK